MPTDDTPGLLTRLASPFREFGWAAGTAYFIDRALRKLSPNLGLYVYEFMVQPIGGKPLLPPNLSRNLSFQEILKGDPAIADMPAREDIKARRFEQGARCLGAYRKGQLIGYLWYATGRYEEDEVRCDYVLVDNAASIFDLTFTCCLSTAWASASWVCGTAPMSCWRRRACAIHSAA